MIAIDLIAIDAPLQIRKPQLMIQAIIFDFDGTILETEVPDYRSWQEVYTEHGGVLDMETWLQCVGGGVDVFDPYAYLEGQIGANIDREVIRARRKPRYLELVAGQGLRPGVKALLASAVESGVKLAVASSSNRSWVEGHLVEREIRHHFGAVCTSDDVAKVKPDPALYRLAAERLGVDPKQAVAVEDSRNGMLSAKRAGLRCVVVPNPITAGQDFSEADRLMETLDGVRLADLPR